MVLFERLMDGWLGRVPLVREAWAMSLRVRNEWSGNRPTQVEAGCWLGAVPSRRRWRELEAAGVTHVVSLIREGAVPSWLASAAMVLWLPVPDRSAPTAAQLRAGVEFLDAAHASQQRVLVFCGSGKGRAPTLYAAWLLAREGISAAQAVEMLHERRPLVMPTSRQLAALQTWATTAVEASLQKTAVLPARRNNQTTRALCD
jgi:hypothetical protein